MSLPLVKEHKSGPGTGADNHEVDATTGAVERRSAVDSTGIDR